MNYNLNRSWITDPSFNSCVTLENWLNHSKLEVSYPGQGEGVWGEMWWNLLLLLLLHHPIIIHPVDDIFLSIYFILIKRHEYPLDCPSKKSDCHPEHLHYYTSPHLISCQDILILPLWQRLLTFQESFWASG